MIEAENHPLLTPFWRRYIANSIRNHFDAVRLRVTAPDPHSTPTLFQMTHVSWWDGYLGVALVGHLGLEHRVMMLEENLSKYRFLRYAGAFSLARGSTRGALESMRYAGAQLETRPPRGLVMFPAGDIGSPHVRPAPYQSGAASLALSVAKRVPLQVRSVAIRLEHRGAAKPEALLRVGAPVTVDASLKTAALSATLQTDLERETEALKADLERDDFSAYGVMLRGTGGMQQVWDQMRRAVGVKV